VTRSSKVRSSRRPGAPEQRAEPKFEFSWTNDERARIRLARALLARDDDELLAVFQTLIPVGVVPDMLEGLAHTRRHVAILHSLLDASLMRSFAVLERCGYGVDNESSENGRNLRRPITSTA
jgi:hypothetical protein